MPLPPPAPGTLGLLAPLAGNWKGTGFNMIAVPNFQNGSIFRIITNQTCETLNFTPIAGDVPNRGSAQGDINIRGLTYLQQVFDVNANMAGIHIEAGIWINVPKTSAPNDPPTVVRQSTIPHGDSLIAEGGAFKVKGGPQIAPVSPLPFPLPGQPPLPLGYTDPYLNGQFAPGFNMQNPNQALVDAIAKQTIVDTTVIIINTEPVGGIVNIPFVTTNANATSMNAIFWIEDVKTPTGIVQQLQYTQTVNLVFDGVVWPHISVATLQRAAPTATCSPAHK